MFSYLLLYFSFIIFTDQHSILKNIVIPYAVRRVLAPVQYIANILVICVFINIYRFCVVIPFNVCSEGFAYKPDRNEYSAVKSYGRDIHYYSFFINHCNMTVQLNSDPDTLCYFNRFCIVIPFNSSAQSFKNTSYRHHCPIFIKKRLHIKADQSVININLYIILYYIGIIQR